MGLLASIQSVANVQSSKTYVTNQLFTEEDIAQLRLQMSVKNNKWARSLGAFVEEKSCSLEKAKSYAIKCSINKVRGSKTVTLFCNAGSIEDVLKEHPTAVSTKPDPTDPKGEKTLPLTLQDCLNMASADVKL